MKNLIIQNPDYTVVKRTSIKYSSLLNQVVCAGGMRPTSNNPKFAHPQNPVSINVPTSNANPVVNIPIVAPGFPNGFITVPIPNVPPPAPVTTIVSGTLPPPLPEIVKVTKHDGCTCKKCKEFFPYAEPNQEDGSLICYACRHGY